MELTAIYHRPESEYAYLYKDGQLHIRIRTKKEDIKRIVLHYGDPFIFIEDLYEATKEMDRQTTSLIIGKCRYLSAMPGSSTSLN